MSTDESKSQSSWNSLEVVKLLVGLAVPVAILLATNSFTAHEDKVKADLDARQKITEHDRALADEQVRRLVDRRFEIWETAAPLMNDLYSYFLYVGKWKSLSPAQMIAHKRELDSLMYANKVFFSDPLFAKYTSFVNSAFATHQGWEHEPKLLTVGVRPSDKSAASEMFAGCDNFEKIYQTYWDLQLAAAEELKLPPTEKAGKPVQPPMQAQAEPCPQ